MYRNAYQRGMLTVFFSVGSKPLNIWETHTQDGYITRFLDQDIKSMVLEIGGTNVSTTYMICPKGNTVLGITMPFLVMIVKNLKKYFTFEVTILDETGTRRRFRVSNFQSSTQILPLCTVMPIGLSDGWNQIQFNLAEFTRRAYKKQFVEVQKLKINANIRLRRVYFTERLIPEDQLPPEYKLYFPLASKGVKGKKGIADAKDKENIQDAPPQATPVEEKKEEVAPEVPKVGSKAEVVKSGSKASVHSVKKSPSKQGSKVMEDIPEGEAPLGSKKTSVVSIPAAVAEGEEVAPEGEVPVEETTEALDEVAAEATAEAVGEGAPEEAPPAAEEAPPPEGEPPAPEAEAPPAE